jgi:hypothetical protein
MRSITIFRPLAAAFSDASTVSVARLGGLALLWAATLAAQAQLKITTTSVPAGVVGVIYSSQFVFTATGGVQPYTWTWYNQIPPGLQLNTSGTIYGFPRVVGNYNVTVRVTDAAGSINQASFTIQINAAGVSVVSSPLPTATVGQSYTQAVVSGGTPPYTLTVTSGTLPAGLSLSSTGVLTGIPTSAGTFSFGVQVTDSQSQSATGTLTLTINPQPLQITNPVGPLFNGTAGTPYTPTTFSAAGGVAPYTWTIVSGNADGLTMSPGGVLTGTPQTDGSFSFVVQVADQSGFTATQTYSLVVNKPSLVITASSFPTGTVGQLYSQTSPAAVASGGTPPYTWSLASGSVPGLSFVPSNVALTGTPSSPGSFPITLQVTDTAGLTATKAFTVTIAAATLTITGSRQLPAATLNAPYSQQMTASGGAPPYTWAANGLPKGLTINPSTGLISGIPVAAGNFPIIVITVIDSAVASNYDNFSLNVTVPPIPSVTISGLPSAVDPASQVPLQVNLSAAYANDITGQLIIGSQPNTGLSDSTIQFSTGGKTASFIITAGNTSATFLDNNGIPVSQLQIQTGTVAGSISVSLSNLNAAGLDVTPVPAPVTTAQIAPAAPVVTNVVVTRNGANGCPSGQLCLQVTGFSTAREVTQAVYTFTAATGQSLQSSAGSITVDVSQVFTTWFAGSTIGSQFILSQPFTVQGDPTAVVPTSVTLGNRVGTTKYTIQ